MDGPANIEAEQALLGAILVNNDVAMRVRDFLAAEHFFEPVHQRIYDAALALIDRNIVATPITLKTQFDADLALDGFGGAAYLARLMGSAVSILSAEDYGRTVHEDHQRRRLVVLAEDIIQTATTQTVTPTEMIDQCEVALGQISHGGSANVGAVPIQRAADALIEHLDNTTGTLGVMTALPPVDRVLGGFMRGALLIIGGRPSMGKSAIGLSLALSAANQGATGIFFSLEMSSRELMARSVSRILATSSRPVPYQTILKRDMDALDKPRVKEAIDHVRTLPLFLDDTPGRTASAIKAQCKRINRRLERDGKKLDFIVVDHLTLMRDSGRYRDNRNNQIGEITADLKALAKDLDLCVVALCQLNRGVEGREDKRPGLSDLRESGNIEQDADAVAFVFREEYYLQRQQPKPGDKDEGNWNDRMMAAQGRAQLIVQKNRNGATATIELTCDIANNYFSEVM